MTITHRERVCRALRHEETDRTPVDFGGAHETGIQAEAYVRLLKYLGLPSELPEGDWQSEGEATLTPGGPVLSRFDIDVRAEVPPENIVAMYDTAIERR